MISVFALHPLITDATTLLKYLQIENQVDVVWNPENPDILFASEHIYTSSFFFSEFRRLYYRAKIRIILEYEAEKPDWNLFDYAIGFDNKYQDPDRFIRIFSPLDMYNKFISKRKNEIITQKQAREELKGKTSFCNFLYSNPNAHPMRDRLFFELSRYKKVDSLGQHLNNVGKEGTGFVNHAGECVQIKRPYKFSIASENAVYNGYTSEKIFTSLEAHTIPIYFGNPDVADDVNPEAYINVSDFESLDSLVKYIEQVDKDDDLWIKYVSAPWFTDSQEQEHKLRTILFKEKILGLLATPVAGKEKIAIGTRSDIYRSCFLNNMFKEGIAPRENLIIGFCKKIKQIAHLKL